MSIFIDEDKIMTSLEKHRLKYIKSIINTKDNVKNNLLRLVLCLPRLEYLLFNRLLNIIEKYEIHFNEKIPIFNNIIKAFNDRTGAIQIKNKNQRYDIKKIKNIINIARQENIKVSTGYMNLFNKHYYRYCDKRDNLLIKLMTNYGFFDSRLFPICKYCGKDNSRVHIINECPNKFFTDLRNEYSKKVGEYLNIDKDKLNLDEGLKEIYFQPKDNSITDGLKILKNYAAKLYIERPDPA